VGVDILLLGLGQTGASVGLALGRSGSEFRRTGYDPDMGVARAAHKAGAVDRLTSDPRLESRTADLVFFNLSSATRGPALDAVASDLKNGAVLIDMTPLKRSAIEAIPARLAAGAAFVGAVPILGADRVFHPDAPQASGDLFQDGLLALVLPPGTAPEAVEVCTDLAVLLGAQPFFLDAAELDAANAASEALPMVLAAAYLRSLAASPAWRDQGRLAARAFEGFTRLAALRPPADLAQDLAANRSNVLRWIDAFLGELGELRQLVAQADSESLSQPFEDAVLVYQAWKSNRLQDKGESAAAVPPISTGSALARMLGLRRPLPPR
jgi:prephenate dehydrogenase